MARDIAERVVPVSYPAIAVHRVLAAELARLVDAFCVPLSRQNRNISAACLSAFSAFELGGGHPPATTISSGSAELEE
jgi:hypothetical protein